MTERFHPSIVTTDKNHFEKIREAEDLGLQTVCVFLTGIDNRDETEALLAALRESTIGWVPLVHLRTDSLPSDVEFFMEHFKTEVFNTHPSYHGEPINPALEVYRDRICLENAEVPLDEAMVNKWGGICADFAHLEAARIDLVTGIPGLPNKYRYYDVLSLMDRDLLNPNVKVAHISTITDHYSPNNGGDGYSWHRLEQGTSLNYLRQYAYLLPQVCALELENSLFDQQKIAARLEKEYPNKNGGEILWQNSQAK